MTVSIRNKLASLSAEKQTVFNLLCSNFKTQSRRGSRRTVAPSVSHTPTCALHPSWQTPIPHAGSHPLQPIRSVTFLPPELPETARGVQKHNLTFGKGQISHSACLWALGTKAAEFTSFNWAIAFVLGNGGLGVGPAPDQPLLERTVRGSQTSGPSGPLTDVPLPCHMHRSARTHAHTHTHSTLPSTFSRMHHTIPSRHIKRKAPQLLLKSNGFAPKDGSSRVQKAVMHGRQTLPPVDIVTWIEFTLHSPPWYQVFEILWKFLLLCSTYVRQKASQR